MNTETEPLAPRNLLRRGDATQLVPFEHVNKIMSYTPRETDAITDLLGDQYFVAFHDGPAFNRLLPGDIVIARWPDFSKWAQILIREVAGDRVKVTLMTGATFEDDAVTPPGAIPRRTPGEGSGGACFIYGGPVNKWSAEWESLDSGTRRTVRKSGFPTEAEARQWYAAHLQTVERTTKKAGA